MTPVQMIHSRKLFERFAIYITKSLGFRRSQIFWGDIIQPAGFSGGASDKKFHLPVQETQETRVQPLGWEDPLK